MPSHRPHERHFYLEQEAGRNGFAAPNEGILPSAHFRHGEQRAMARGSSLRQHDPGPVEELVHPTEIPRASWGNFRMAAEQ